MYSRSAGLVATSALMSVLALGATALRFQVKRWRQMHVGAEDVLLLVGLVLAIGICICNIIGAARYRFGNHEIFIEDGPLEGWPEAWLLLGYGKIFYALQLLHATAMPVLKTSLLLFLRRIFGHLKSFKIALKVIGTYIFLWWLTTFWMSVFQCWPISSNWGTTPAQMGDCIPNYMTWYSWAALLNVLSDVAIVIVPIPLVWRLQMGTIHKVVTISILLTAGVVIAAGIGRTVGYFTYDHESLDFTYVFYDFLIWTSIEPCLGVVGCCLPALGPLFETTTYNKLKKSLSLRSLLHRSSRSVSSDEERHLKDIADLQGEIRMEKALTVESARHSGGE